MVRAAALLSLVAAFSVELLGCACTGNVRETGKAVSPVAPPKRSASAVASAPASPSSTWRSAPPSPIPSPLEGGCFAISGEDRGAACAVGASSIQGGGRYDLSFIGAKPARFRVGSWGARDFAEHPLQVASGDVAIVEARLRDRGYRPVPAKFVDVELGATVTVGATRIRLMRRNLKTVNLVDGSSRVVSDTISVQCAPDPAWVKLEEVTMEGPTASTAKVRVIDEHTLLIERATTFHNEGDGGGSTSAIVVETETCKAAGHL